MQAFAHADQFAVFHADLAGHIFLQKLDAGQVGGEFCGFQAEAHVAVNHDGVRLASQAPPIPQLTAYLLGLLPKAKRENVLKTLPEIFAAAD